MNLKPKNGGLEKKNILILGGGFAGVRAALDLASLFGGNDDFEIILVDRKDYHLYTPALYEAATAQHGLVEAKQVKRAMTIPFSSIFAGQKVKVFKAYIDKINLESGLVVTDSRIINFSYLLIAMGSASDYFGIPGIEKHGFGLKSLEDAIMIRNRVEDIVAKKDSGKFVIAGGGYTGVEFAGELHNLIKHECEFHKKDVSRFDITVVEGATNFIPGLPENISGLIARRLAALGVKTLFSTLVTDAVQGCVTLNNKDTVECDLLVWAGGVKSCRPPCDVDVLRDKKGRAMVSDKLNLKKYPNVFFAGDVLCLADGNGAKNPPQTAQEAIKQARVAAKNIYRMATYKPPLSYLSSANPYVIPVSGKYAIFYTKDMVISGKVGWWIRRIIDLRYFIGILPITKAFKLWLFENRLFAKND
jgi:NADH dehydrogenase